MSLCLNVSGNIPLSEMFQSRSPALKRSGTPIGGIAMKPNLTDPGKVIIAVAHA
jgi:hypothetical protein